MTDASLEFNRQLELDVLVNGLTEVTEDYIGKFDWRSFDEVVIPNGVTRIGDGAFEYCRSLTSVTIPVSMTSIGYEAFKDCWDLRSATIPDSVTSIGSCAFLGCSRLIDIIIPLSVTRIGSSAFYNCHVLTSVLFINRTLDEVRSMDGYPWDISPEKISVQVA